MVFTSSVFLFVFLPVTVLLYYFCKPELKNYVLLAMSLIFYAWGEPKLVLLMLLSIIVNYVLALIIEKNDSRKALRTFILVLSVVYNLGALFYFKYFNFFFNTLTRITGHEFGVEKIALPIGISFFTFQIMSYVIDVYRREVEAQKNPFYLGLYISLFPQLIAGPIVRYKDVALQIESRSVDTGRFYEGAMRFMKGFSKKVLIADQTATVADYAFSNIGSSAILSWLGVVAYTLQIYFDFSGYSDMAIGLGKIFGFDFVENFNFPYISQSIKEFWRRWHISLSTWFKDYVYIPLGGSRRGTARTYVNLMIIFLLTGLWHGASWNFVFWGVYYGIFLILERLFLGKLLEKAPKAVRHIYTIAVVAFGWIFFRANGFSEAITYIRSLVNITPNDYAFTVKLIDGQMITAMLLGIILAVPHEKIISFLRGKKYYPQVRTAVMFVIFILAICFMTGSGFSPFLYFRF